MSSAFVSQKLFKLFPAPTHQSFVKRPSKSFLRSDRQLLKHENIKRKIDYHLRYTVIGIFNKTVFLSTQLLQKTFSRFCAFFSQLVSKMRIFAFNLSEMFGVNKLIVRKNSNLFDASVNTKNFITRRTGLWSDFKHCYDIPLILGSLILKFTRRFKRLPVSIYKWIVNKWNFYSSLSGREFNACSSVGTRVSVKTDSREFMRSRFFCIPLPFGFALDSFESFNGFCSGRANQLRREVRLCS